MNLEPVVTSGKARGEIGFESGSQDSRRQPRCCAKGLCGERQIESSD